MKTSKKSLALAVILSLGVCANAWAAGPYTQNTTLGDEVKIYGSQNTAVGFEAICGRFDNDSPEELPLYYEATYGSAFGYKANVREDTFGGSALGAYSKVFAKNSVALGFGSQALEENVVSVGRINSEWDDPWIGTIQRRIVNVAAAKNSNEALTFSNFLCEDPNDDKIITGMDIGGTKYKFAVGEKITIDDTFSTTSKNPVENQLITNKINDMDTKVGDNNYATNPTYVTNGDSATKAIGDLDAALKNEADEREAADKDLQNQINNLGGNLASDVERLDSDVKSVGAMAAAMAGLHPRFTGDGKGEFAAAIGSYDGKKATAIGAFYAPDERFMFSLGGAFAAGGKKMANLGVNIALDPKPHVNKKFYEKEIAELKADVNAKLAEKDAQIEALMQRLAALEAKK